MKPIYNFSIAAAAFVLIISGCDSTSTNTGAQNRPRATAPNNSNSIALQGGGKSKNFDGRLLRLAKAIPSFGGIYYKEGKPVIYLRHPGEKEKVLSSIKNNLAPLPDGNKLTTQLDDMMNNPELKVEKAAYSFKQLYSWKQAAFNLLHSMDGVVSVDIDDRSNNVLIGLNSLSLKQQVEKKLNQADIPLGGIIFEKRNPAVRLSLRGKHRPTYAGLQIEFLQNGSINTCTTGPVVQLQYGGSSHYGFLTAAHCTINRQSVLGVEYFQSTYPYDHTGIEQRDMPYYSSINGFYGDVAFVETDNGLQVNNWLPRTVKWSSGCYYHSPDCTEDPSNTHFTVFNVGGNEFVGSSSNKVGITTGWTDGNITNQCLDIKGDDGLWTRCSVVVERPSNRSTNIADYGDSGSPVFQLRNDYANDGSRLVTLTGVLWGGNGGGINTYEYYYTSWNDIHNAHGLGYSVSVLGANYEVVGSN